MAAIDVSETCLMLDQRKLQAFPFAMAGFSVVDRPLPRVREELIGVLFLLSSGEVVTIDSISRSNEGLLAAIRERVGFPVRVNVSFHQEKTTLDEFQVLLIEAMKKYDNEFKDDNEVWSLARSGPDIRERQIQSTKSLRELFTCLGLPDVKDCLDIM